MDGNDFHEGAKALLDLKKDEKKKEDELDAESGKVNNNIININNNSSNNININNNNSNNDVEAALMKYVAGTLERKSSKRKKSFVSDEISDFQHWNAFLNTESITEDDGGAGNSAVAVAAAAVASSTSSGTTPKKHGRRKKHKNALSNSDVAAAANVDPELAQLDDTIEHEQIVRAAIANQLGSGVDMQDFIQQPADNETDLDSNLINTTEAEQQQLEAVAAAAAAAAAAVASNNADIGPNDSDRKNAPATSTSAAQTQTPIRSKRLPNITNPSIISQHENQQHNQQQKLEQSDNNNSGSGGVRASGAASGVTSASQDLNSSNNNSATIINSSGSRHPDLRAPATQNLSEIASLVNAAALKASQWVGSHTQGKMFSSVEIEAIDKFIEDYCQINNITRRQVCQRVWSNERRKDDFWESVHKVLPYRTRASVYKHVRRAYHIFEVRGKWTPEEDEILSKLASEKDGQWKLIGQEMSRMPEDCRDRWRNYLKCGANRASNKWSIQEEERLTTIISDILREKNITLGPNDPTIGVLNWTQISEKMGGTRSRIQCRYKWNKLMIRDAMARVQNIDLNDRIWLLTKLQELRFIPESSIDWDAIARIHPKNMWTGADLKNCYEKMRSTIRDFKKKNLFEICSALLHDLINDATRNNIDIEIELPEELKNAQVSGVKTEADDNKEMMAHSGSNSLEDGGEQVKGEGAAGAAGAAQQVVSAGKSEESNTQEEYIWR